MNTRWSSDPRPTAADYDARWTELAAEGGDPHGEARFVLGYRPGSVLDAGCGTGRVAIELARHGVDVAGVDLDAGFIEGAREKAPELDWHRGDLATVDLGRRFDLVVLAGNVMIFVAPGTEIAVLTNLAAHLNPGGRVVAGFQLGGARLTVAEFDLCAKTAGLLVDERFGTWERDPFPGRDYAVSVLTHGRDSQVSAHVG